MRQETKIATVENVVTAICFGVGALLVVLALYTLMAVKTVSADGPFPVVLEVKPTGPGDAFARRVRPGTFPGSIMEGTETGGSGD